MRRSKTFLSSPSVTSFCFSRKKKKWLTCDQHAFGRISVAAAVGAHSSVVVKVEVERV